MKNLILILMAFLLGLFCNSCNSCNSCNPIAFFMDDSSPKIGLALGGGGAKAAAEIGVLKYLENEGIKIDCIAGTSMGAVVGGLYAAGYTACEIDSLWQYKDWIKLFDEKYIFNIRNGDRNFLGVIHIDIVESELRNLLQKKGCKYIKDSKIKFTCTATKIIDDKYLEEYIFKPEDDMAKAIVASMTYPAPGVFNPLEYKGMKLVDGGMLNNIPIDVVLNLGADKVIAVDLEKGVPYHMEEKHADSGNNKGLSQWLANWLKNHPEINRRYENWNNFKAKVIIIHIDFSYYGNYNIRSFNDHKEIMGIGESETKKLEKKIKSLTQ